MQAEVLSIRRLEGSRWPGGRVWSLKRDLVLPGGTSKASGYAEKLLCLWQMSLDWARQLTKSPLGQSQWRRLAATRHTNATAR
jgi:hypothetical protein